MFTPPISIASQSISSGLDRILDYALAMNVKLDCIESADAIHLDLIARMSGSCPGSGAAVMRALIGYSEQIGKPIRLYIIFYEPKLIEFYEAFDFVVDPMQNDEAWFVRQPANQFIQMKGMAA